MSAAVPVIASGVGGLPEVVRDRETGLLWKTRPPRWPRRRQLAGDPAFARRMGQAARRAVIENFTVDRMVRRTMEFITRCSHDGSLSRAVVRIADRQFS